jgi:5-methylcytosine-specific restriction endonuclease McrA
MAPCLSGDQSDDRPSLDHIIPRSKGGPDTWANVQAVHRRCNLEKADTMPAAHEMAYAP